MEAIPERVALVVEDHALTRALLCDTLTHAGFVAVAAADAREALADFRAIDPDVLITDIDLGAPPNGIELAVALTAVAPHLAVVFLSNYASAAQVPGGVTPPPGSTFLRKADLESTSSLLEAVESVLHESTPHPSTSGLPASPLAGLTRRQLLVLCRMAEGWSNVEIAEREGMSVSALEKMTTRLFTALGLHDDARVNPRVVATRMYIEAFGPPRSALPR